MHKEVISCEETREFFGIRLTPIVRSTLAWADIGGTVTFYVYKQPAYVLIEQHSGVRVIRISGEDVNLRQVYSECPSIREVLVERYPALPAQGN